MAKGENLSGRRFGYLTVLCRAERQKNRRAYWLCRCDCGREVLIESTHLKSGHTKSCGCYRRIAAKSRSIDISGKRFGRLTALEPVKDENSSGLYWRCRCDCGREIICSKDNLRSGNSRSCGCFQKEVRRENMKKAIHFVEGTCVERISSRTTSSNNTSGHRGVYRRENNKWRAAIGFQGKLYNLGTFARYEDAVQARLDAEKRLYDPFLEQYRKQSGTTE